VGRTSCAMIAVIDTGFAASLTEKLAAAHSGAYSPAAQLLRDKAEKDFRLQKQQRQHARNIQRGKKKPWAPPPNRQ